MIGFGELRKFSTQWQVDITAVERVYVIDWILKAIFDDAMLSQALVLRGGAALRYLHSAVFPIADDPEFLLTQKLDNSVMQNTLTTSLNASASTSELRLSLVSYERGAGRVEYTGPLGRRSAAQPRVTLSVVPGQPQLDPVRLPLLHPFSDDCHTTIAAIALDEFVGERIAALARTPRVRDVYNLWFVMMNMRDRLNVNRTSEIAQKKNVALTTEGALFDPKHRSTLGRAWDNALHEVRGHPSFTQVEHDLNDSLKFIFAN